jgi:hypothetical protein
MAEFRRPAHARVAALLRAMDGAFLARAGCFFGGGTQLAMSCGEYRESRDIGFLCAAAGYRLVRETVSGRSLGRLFARPVSLAREVLADRDGVRTFVEDDQGPLKLAIVLEARIPVRGALDRSLGVPALDPASAAAEKFLANADRGLDQTFRSRDLVDLAFLLLAQGPEALHAGLAAAQGAYGVAVLRSLRASLRKLSEDRDYFRRCVADLAIDDSKALRRGLVKLQRFAARGGRAGRSGA